MILRVSSSLKEGGDRMFCVLTKRFEDDGAGHVAALHAVKVEWVTDEHGRRVMREVPGPEFRNNEIPQIRIPCELVLLAMGFVAPEADAFIAELGLEWDKNRFGQAIKADERFQTARPGVFVAGDARRGQSLVVWAIHEGREAARAMDRYLMGRSDLPAANTQGYAEF